MGSLDRIDANLLRLLQEDAHKTNAELADQVGLSVSACAKRIARLHREGWITRLCARLDEGRFPTPVTVAVMITLAAPKRDVTLRFEARMRDLEQVQQCHTVAGDFDFLLMVCEQTVQSYHEFAQTAFGASSDVKDYKSIMVVKTGKCENFVPAFALGLLP